MPLLRLLKDAVGRIHDVQHLCSLYYKYIILVSHFLFHFLRSGRVKHAPLSRIYHLIYSLIQVRNHTLAVLVVNASP